MGLFVYLEPDILVKVKPHLREALQEGFLYLTVDRIGTRLELKQFNSRRITLIAVNAIHIQMLIGKRR